MNNLEVIIGIEIHIELNTKTKMFSSSPNNFDALPNVNVSPIDIGYPGALPVVNKEAVIKAIKCSKALNMNIENTLYFDRKNYYYPDLPKGYQITQDKRPIGKKGFITLANGKIINIERVQIEEDTAKSIHKGKYTYLNYNRSGVPLIEIVSEPEISNANEAIEYVQTIKDVALALNISDAKMEEGSLRADINISLRPYGQKEFGTKVEIKNLNSIANIEKSISKEIQKQTKKILTGKVILQETKRFDELTQDTITMRVKTSAIDYRFFPEPNIPPIYLGDEFINKISIEELPWEKKQRYKNENISEEYISILLSNLEYSKYFDKINYHDKSKLSKIFFAEIVSIANAKKVSLEKLNINKNQLVILLENLEKGIVSGKHVKNIMPLLIGSNKSTNDIIIEKNISLISDENILNNLINEIFNENKEFIEQNKERKERVIKFIIGTLMKKSKGQANPILSHKLVINKIK